MSYNTSWVLDCSRNQFNAGLSESAAIIHKMAHITGKTNIEELFNDPNYADNLDTFRLALADKATEYIKAKITDNYDFLALIEQSMHLPKDDHANYDEISDGGNKQKYMTNKFDLDNENENYGFLRRMKKLELDRTNPAGQNYTVAYDNCINRPFNAGEGIAILYKKTLVDNPLTWDQSVNPNSSGEFNKIPDLNDPTKINKIPITNGKFNKSGPINFYSDDLGPIICKDATGNVIYVKANGVSDEGRPIILTGGLTNDGTLNLFMAAHGPNILNLFENTEGFKTLIAEEKKLIAEEKKLSDEEKKLSDEENTLSKEENTADENRKKEITARKQEINTEKQPHSIKNFAEDKLTGLFQQSGAAISGFVQKAIDACTNNDIMSSVTKCQLFIGGDFNDAWGHILTGIVNNGIPVKINDKPMTITFNYPELKLDKRGKFGKSKNVGYDLMSCCANADSVIDPNEQFPLGPIIPPTGTTDADTTTNTKKLIERLGKYPNEFYKPEKFGYNGDYALFGTSDTSDKSEYELKLDNNDAQKYTATDKTVIASDHLPVISNIKTNAGSYGGKRRYKTLVMRKKNRRTRRKKNITKRNRRRY
jgi:hypothetical protein